MNEIDKKLAELAAAGNRRVIPRVDAPTGIVDLSANDYLGIAADRDFIERFYSALRPNDFIPTSSASRLLASHQRDYTELEDTLSQAYGRSALIFNSGYHANTGIIRALASKGTLFIADKLVHASIIDGLALASAAGAAFVRFRHNDWDHLGQVVEKNKGAFKRIVIVAESVYSMDGDCSDLDRLVEIRDSAAGAMLYLDEAHSVGVTGPHGLGMAYGHPAYEKVDIVVGTFGKALASAGAYVVTSERMREYLVNTSRSLIFSTALPPVVARWSLATFRKSFGSDAERRHLRALGRRLQDILGTAHAGHIQPYIVGDAEKAVALSQKLMENGFRVLPIRTPTVPAGTERLRFSLSASVSTESLEPLRTLL